MTVLRKHGRVPVFRNNLERLVKELKRTPGAPAIRYITMAFRSNRQEIPGLVRWMNESGMAWQIEIRYTFNTSNIGDEFRREHYMNADEGASLRRSLDALPYRNYTLAVPPGDYGAEEPYMPANWFDWIRWILRRSPPSCGRCSCGRVPTDGCTSAARSTSSPRTSRSSTIRCATSRRCAPARLSLVRIAPRRAPHRIDHRLITVPLSGRFSTVCASPRARAAAPAGAARRARAPSARSGRDDAPRG